MARWWESLRLPGLWRNDVASLDDLANVGATRPTEFGASGTENYGGKIYGEDYNRDLDGTDAIKKYDEMRRGDAQVKATLQVIKLPLRSATWQAIPPESGDESDRAIADYVNACLFDDDAMSVSWDDCLRHILLQLEFGFSVLEKVWTVDEEGRYRFYRLAPRLPKTIAEWRVNPHGELESIVQYAPRGGQWGYLSIPADYAAVFTLDKEGDNYNGISVLRSAYKHWYFKEQAYRLDAVRLDRYGVGIPRAKVGPTVTKNDLDAIEKVLKGMRSHERAYLIEREGITFDILVPNANGGASGALPSIQHHDQAIARNILAGFLTREGGGDSLGGSRTKTLADMFANALRGVANGIAGDLKRQVVKALCDMNFVMQGRQYPTVQATDLMKVDVQSLGGILNSLKGAEFITPDDDIESLLRKLLDLPPLPEHLKRVNKAAAEAPAGDPVAEALAADPGVQTDEAGNPSDPSTGEPMTIDPTLVPGEFGETLAPGYDEGYQEGMQIAAGLVADDLLMSLRKHEAWRWLEGR